MYIERLNNIDNIIDIQNNFYDQYKIRPYNVSNWTVSNDFRNTMEQVFQLNHNVSPIDYLYSYNISRHIREKIMSKLGVPQNLLSSKTCIFFPNNSLSIVNVCNFLQKNKIKRVGIINPAYFSIATCLDTYHISYETLYVKREKQEYVLPMNEILSKNLDVIWITSPIYSTGSCYGQKELEKIKILLEKGIWIIADESFCIQGKELIRDFTCYNNFIGIYSPHKALSINSYKFSVIVVDIEYEDFFEQWLDILCGNLPQTTIAAIYHFLSSNFEQCQVVFEKFIRNALKNVEHLLTYYPSISTDKNIHGNMMTLYIDGYNYDSTQKLSYIEKVIRHTHTLYYPGSLNGFPAEWGFCFRINLALFDSEFISTLQRLLIYLHDHSKY